MEAPLEFVAAGGQRPHFATTPIHSLTTRPWLGKQNHLSENKSTIQPTRNDFNVDKTMHIEFVEWNEENIT